MRTELHEHRRERMSDIKSLEDLNNVKEDIRDTKRMVMDVKNNVCSIGGAVVSSRGGAASSAPIAAVSSSGTQPLTMAQVVVKGLPRASASIPTRPAGPPRRHGVFGTKKTSPSNKIVGVERNLDVFVGRCRPHTTCQMYKCR